MDFSFDFFASLVEKSNKTCLLEINQKYPGALQDKISPCERDNLIAFVIKSDLTSMFSFLLDTIGGFDLEHKNKRGQTALILACEYGRYIIVERLIKERVDITVRDIVGYNAFSYALMSGSSEIVEELIEAGAKVFESIPFTFL